MTILRRVQTGQWYAVYNSSKQSNKILRLRTQVQVTGIVVQYYSNQVGSNVRLWRLQEAADERWMECKKSATGSSHKATKDYTNNFAVLTGRWQAAWWLRDDSRITIKRRGDSQARVYSSEYMASAAALNSIPQSRYSLRSRKKNCCFCFDYHQYKAGYTVFFSCGSALTFGVWETKSRILKSFSSWKKKDYIARSRLGTYYVKHDCRSYHKFTVLIAHETVSQ